MTDLEMQSWQTLHCVGCPSAQFVALVELRIKPGGGSTANQAGWQCASCGAKADIPAMQRALTLAQRRRELEALEAELERDDPTPQPVRPGYRPTTA